MIPWTVAHQAPLSVEFSRQEYWHGVPFPSPGDLPKPEIEPRSPTLQANSLLTEPPPGKSNIYYNEYQSYKIAYENMKCEIYMHFSYFQTENILV